MLFLLLSALAAAQEDLSDVDLLYAEDIRIREAAERRLAGHGPDWISLLRHRSAVESDVEVKARLEAAANVILMRQVGHLLGEGLVEETLRVLSRDERNLDDFLKRNKQAVEDEIRGWFPKSEEGADCAIDAATAADQIRERFGAWGTAVLLEVLGRDEKVIPVSMILVEMNDDVVPCLARALRQGSSTVRKEVCTVLYVRVCVNGRWIEDGSGLAATLLSIEEDLCSDFDTRFYARSVLDYVLAGAEGD